jgi:TrmH family RNA methyltransferase
MPLITSLKNPRVKEAVRLRVRRHREKQGRILIDGFRELGRALGGGLRLIEVFACESLCEDDEAKMLLASLDKCGCEVLTVGRPVFEKLAFGHRAEGLLGVAEMPRPTLEQVAERIAQRRDDSTQSWGGSLTATPTLPTSSPFPHLPLSASPLVAVLEGVEKPGNVGAVIRSADAAGVSAVVLADARTDLFNPNAIRASLGTIFTMPVCAAASGDVLNWLRSQNLRIFTARVDGAVPYTSVSYRGRTALVLGSEAAGLSSIWRGEDIQAVRLPMHGAADSLNVSATAAVLFYEALRQRSA